MNRRALFALTVLTSALLLNVPLRADEDGAYCTAKGYLAYEVRKRAPAGGSEHILKVVRFDPTGGVRVVAEVPLQSFQVHRMICGPDRVEMSGYGNVFKKYTIGLTGPEQARISDFGEDPARKFNPATDGPEPPRFSEGKPTTVALDSPDPGHKYQLAISGAERPVKGGIEHSYRAEVLEVDPSGKATPRLVLYKGRSLETID